MVIMVLRFKVICKTGYNFVYVPNIEGFFVGNVLIKQD